MCAHNPTDRKQSKNTVPPHLYLGIFFPLKRHGSDTDLLSRQVQEQNQQQHYLQLCKEQTRDAWLLTRMQVLSRVDISKRQSLAPEINELMETFQVVPSLLFPIECQ